MSKQKQKREVSITYKEPINSSVEGVISIYEPRQGLFGFLFSNIPLETYSLHIPRGCCNANKIVELAYNKLDRINRKYNIIKLTITKETEDVDIG